MAELFEIPANHPHFSTNTTQLYEMTTGHLVNNEVLFESKHAFDKALGDGFFGYLSRKT